MHAVTFEPDDDARGVGKISLVEMLAAAVGLPYGDKSCEICVVSAVGFEVHGFYFS
jgi:hypothetical protein